MQRIPLQLSVFALLIAVAGIALNLWLFRFGALAGIIGLSVTKHVVIAWLCQVLGVDRKGPASEPTDRAEASRAAPLLAAGPPSPSASPPAP